MKGKIMSNPFRKYDGLSYRDIRWRLRYRKMPEDLIDKTIAELKEHRRARQIAKAKSRERTKQWGEVLASLQHERKIVRSMMRYKTTTPTPERDAFVTAYADALTTLYGKLLAKQKLSQELPTHSHWTDYVPERIKEAFRLESDAIPPRQKAKHKEPFVREDTTRLRNLRQGRLLRHIDKERETTAILLETDPNNEQLQRKEWLLTQATKRARAFGPRDHVPSHWRALVKDL
jgi:hypothetical protein